MSDRGFEKAERLADEARRLSGSGDHTAAERLHREAVALCRDVYAEQEEDAAQGVADPVEHRRAAQALADHLGRLGGSLRRANRLQPALDAYREGARLEQDWRLDDTYNRTNMIMLIVELNPEQLPVALPAVEDALRVVRRKAEGSRREQWWAWADLGLLSLLSGRQDEAAWAYTRYLACDPRPVDIQSTVDVLLRLRRAVAPFATDRAQGLGAAADLLAAAGLQNTSPANPQ